MPIYDFECPQCGHVIENLVQKFDDPPPNCSGETDEEADSCHATTPMTRLIGQSTFRCVGKGWPDQDSKELKARFNKRNKRIESMTPEQQQGFKNIIDRTGGKRYIP